MTIPKLMRAFLSAMAVVSLVLPVQAQDGKKKTLAICEISATPALAEKVATDKKKNELDRVVQSLDGQLIDRMHNTRLFSILAHGDLPAIIKGGTFSAGSLKSLPNLDYVLIATVDDFDDAVAGVDAGVDNGVSYRNARLSVVAKIYSSKSSEVLETANFQLPPSDLATGGVLDDRVLVAAARKMADRIANRVTLVISPPEIIDVTDKQATITWGDGLFIVKGEVWEVWAVKEKKLKTGDVQRILLPVGKVKISRVDPTSSTGEVVEGGTEVKEGCVLRKP